MEWIKRCDLYVSKKGSEARSNGKLKQENIGKEYQSTFLLRPLLQPS